MSPAAFYNEIDLARQKKNTDTQQILHLLQDILEITAMSLRP